MLEDVFQFDDFVLDRGAYELRRSGKVVALQRIPLDLLCLLVERRGQLVTREEIIERVWGKGVFVDSESGINTAIRKLRRALRDDPEAPRFVTTVPARGYRFIADIRAPKKSRAEQIRARPLGVMVGREHELGSMLGGLDDAAAGRGRLFLISGEPGVGKTRLADEVAAAARTKGMALLIGHCSEHEEAVAYLPFVEILEKFIDRAADPERLREALGEQGPELSRLLPKLRSVLKDLAPPLDLPPAQARRHLFSSVCDFVARIAAIQPVLMVLEDLHWADDSTLSLLDHLAQRLSDLPLMAIGTLRDAELNVTRPLAKTLENLLRGRLATGVKLGRLPRDEVGAMLNSLSGKPPPAAVVGEIFAETEGNPFFVEELFRHLEEENRLYDSAGQFRAELKIGELEAPPSVRLVVARRLTRLSDGTQKMLACAALIGRYFSFDVLHAAAAADANSLLDQVEEAERAGLVLSVAESPKARFRFSHELVRQAVLGALPAARRQRLHLEVADAIEHTYGAELDEYSGELAHHYRLGDNLPKAIEYLVRAAVQATMRSAPQQAIALANTGLELLAAVPNDEQHDRNELALQMTLGECSSYTMGWASAESERAYARALELCGRGDRSPAAVRAMVGLYTYYSRGADSRRVSALQAQLLELVPTLTQPRLLTLIHYNVGFKLLYQGDFEAARDQFEQALRWSAGRRSYVTACSAMALVLWNLGYADQASKMIDEAATAIRELPSPYGEVMVPDNACMIRASSKDAQGARTYANEVLAIGTRYGFAGEIAFANIVLAWADGWDGDSKGIDLLQARLAEFKATEGGLGLSWSYALIGELCLKFDRHKEAVAALDDGIELVARSGEGFAEPEIYRLKGEAEMQLGQSHFASAGKWFERAIEAARKRGTKIAELRATASFARLLVKQRKREEARTMLVGIYKWFTEGFDTADLKVAKALLDDLN